MRANIRLLFSALWFPSLGFFFASIITSIVTLGDHLDVLLIAGICFGVSTAVVVISSLE